MARKIETILNTKEMEPMVISECVNCKQISVCEIKPIDIRISATVKLTSKRDPELSWVVEFYPNMGWAWH